MKITSVKYGRTKNIGNYQSERLDVEVTLDKGDTYEEAYDEARSTVLTELEIEDAHTTSMSIAKAKRVLRLAGYSIEN